MDVNESIPHQRLTPPIIKETKTLLTQKQVKEEVTVDEKIFDGDELLMHLRPVWNKINDMEESLPFREPVDPLLLKIPVKSFYIGFYSFGTFCFRVT